ncbi:ribonuclease HII [Corynebacterium bovis]|uniref:Ribonuclease HII n=2 Tax=Corynebacterium bovis TaxID=36808 RepID=A0A3R8VVM1_9CORY|nr:ribonuclease HII [Corynebacterium bovis]WJY77425.1 Ribonuclease HII [Corynebacterium bovis DSM 20582 = CIP 54.80]RRO80293.1 ribonuclease HII [Corynebacterium bovis]RRO80439.1 ribonuclease HII [Corynebacterium bovis]RRO81006.1 ribonuclease HII [Corynebacterium bovis]
MSGAGHPAAPLRAPVRAALRRTGRDGVTGGRALDHAVVRAGLGLVAGVDEAGRGACCGPLTAAACILPDRPLPELDGLTDSKQLSPAARERLEPVIAEVAVAWAVVHVSAAEIDERGIQPANTSAMRRAVAALDVRPGYVLTDALRVPGLTLPHLPVLKGDRVSRSISAASVLAKVARDRVMVELDARYPGYGLAGHKGYGTKAHMASVSLHGGCPEHRYTYANVAAARAQWAAAGGRETEEEVTTQS